jgi:regulator of replication initiation timing
VFEVLTRFVREISEVTDETLMISFCILLIVTTALIAYWFYNRRKFRELSHQIPASVLKNYLDSIIQNSSALKSSLFRGGGLDVGQGIPSVFPAGDLPSGSVEVSGASNEEINQKNAEIASLTKRLADKDAQIVDINEQLKKAQAGAVPVSTGGGNDEEVAILKAEIEDLRAQLAAAQAAPAPAAGGGGDTAELETQLASVTKERDELKERLMEYEIIEEDLANLKRLQQENEQLKATIAQGGGAAAAAAAPAAEAAAEPEPAAEAPAEPEPVAEAPAPAEEVPDVVPEATGGEDLEAQMAAAIEDSAPADEPAAEGDVPANEGEQKSAEELLSEFEKMLG